MASIIRTRNLSPYYLVHPNCLPDLPAQNSSQNFDCVILGDAVDGFSYQNMNEVFGLIQQLTQITLSYLSERTFEHYSQSQCYKQILAYLL